ncbi:MAG: PadR family transcriptional regulator [Bdellovibrionales bacterium]
MNSQFKKGVVEMCVLNLVCQKDRYGYELIETISKEIEISEGTIYPILRRLTKDGYFDTYLKESTGGPPRKYYKITKTGEEASQEMKSDWMEFGQKIKRLLNNEGV